MAQDFAPSQMNEANLELLSFVIWLRLSRVRNSRKMWLHGWAIVAGIVAAGVPVIIHWLTRPRPLRLPLSTLRFVREAVQQRRTTHRLRDALVLTLRVAAVLLIAAAMARPMIGRQDEAVTSDDTAVARIVIVDASHSLAAQSDGVRLFDIAQSVAARELEYRPGLKCNLILAERARGVCFRPCRATSRR